MHNIDSFNAVTVMPTPGAIGPNPNGYFSSGDVSDLEAIIFPTKNDADFYNAVQEELGYAIVTAGIALDKADNGQLKKAIQFYINDMWGGGVGGLPNVEADTAPALGGNLIVSNKKITNAGAINFQKSIDAQSDIVSVKGKISRYTTSATAYLNFGENGHEYWVSGNKIAEFRGRQSLTPFYGLYLSGNPEWPMMDIMDTDDMQNHMDPTNELARSKVSAFTQRSVKKYIDDRGLTLKRTITALIESQYNTSPVVDSAAPYSFMCDDQPIVMPKDATLSLLRIVMAAGLGPGGATVVFTLRKNGVATALTVTLTANNTPQDVTDSTHTVSVSEGDVIDIYATTVTGSNIKLPYMDASFKGV